MQHRLPFCLAVLLASTTLLAGGCAERGQVIDCWVLPESELAAAVEEGRCGDAFERYYRSTPPNRGKGRASPGGLAPK